MLLKSHKPVRKTSNKSRTKHHKKHTTSKHPNTPISQQQQPKRKFTTQPTTTTLPAEDSEDSGDGRITIHDEVGFTDNLVEPVNLTQPGMFKIKQLTKQLQAINSSQPQREAWWIISSKSGIPENILRKAGSVAQPGVPEPDLDISSLLNPMQLAAVEDALKQRIEQRKPLQYVLGDVEFCKMKLQTKEGVLIPRPETEQITTWLVHQIKLYNQYVLHEHGKKHTANTANDDAVATAAAAAATPTTDVDLLIQKKILLDYTEQVDTLDGYPLHRFRWSWYDAVEPPFQIKQKTKQKKQDYRTQTEGLGGSMTKIQELEHELNTINIFDLCTGSGNIALSLATQFPQARVVGVDVDKKALNLSRLNKANLGVENAQFFHCDVFQNSIYSPTPINMEEDDSHTTSAHLHHMRSLKHPYSSENSKLEDMDVFHNTKERFIGLYDLPMLTSLTDIIVSNPPYIRSEEMDNLDPEVHRWENHMALTPFEHIYRHPDVGQPIQIPPNYTARTAEQRAKLPPWPTVEQIREHALPFYERIIKSAPRLLTHNEHYIPKQNIKFPRLVLEIGHPEQAKLVADMASYMFDVELYLDAYDRVRWVVGYEPRGYL